MFGGGGSVANQPFLLRVRRRYRRDLLQFLGALELSVQAGYDLAYAWPKVAAALGGMWEPGFRDQIALGSRSLPEFLEELKARYPDRDHALWFGILAHHYSLGVSVGQTLRAMGESLRREQSRAWEEHLRTLPTRVSLVLAVFFVAPALWLLFAPLLSQVSSSWP